MTQVSKIIRARLPRRPRESLWDITLRGNEIIIIEPHIQEHVSVGILDADGRLLAPSLCHAHVHLDKCFLLPDEKYQDLEIVSGDFQEAMRLTGEAKQRFQHDDLLRRGRRLIQDSIDAAVTSMRAFVEVDEIVELKCVRAARDLKLEFQECCHIQICVFAQLALFSGDLDVGKRRRQLLEEALAYPEIDAIGSTPYVEDDILKSTQNISWTIGKVLETGKHLDFHLDYNLDPEIPATIWTVLEELNRQKWTEKAASTQTICLGHCTRLTHFRPSQWETLAAAIGDLSISFIGLPMSDLFMMGRPKQSWEAGVDRLRGTLQVPALINLYQLRGAIAINNVGNAFTPQGTCDPLALASLGVGIYQSGTTADAELLYECVSTRARNAIGLGPDTKLGNFIEGDSANLVLFGSVDQTTYRPKTIADVVYHPASIRQVIYRGMAGQ